MTWSFYVGHYIYYHGARFVSEEQEFVSFASVLRFVGDVRELALFFENNFGFSSLFDFPEPEPFRSKTVLDSNPSDSLPWNKIHYFNYVSSYKMLHMNKTPKIIF